MDVHAEKGVCAIDSRAMRGDRVRPADNLSSDDLSDCERFSLARNKLCFRIPTCSQSKSGREFTWKVLARTLRIEGGGLIR